MKHLSLPLAAIFIALSCSKSLGGLDSDQTILDPELAHGEIVLGEQLENPYSVDNVKSAISSLYPDKARIELNATDLYVRFLPSNEEQLELLIGMGLNLLDHPVDYKIVREGDYYHDPQLDEQDITWQYAVVPANFVFPEGIRYEKLDDCYLAENASDKSKAVFGDIDWSAVERQAFSLTGNAAMLSDAADNKSGGEHPSGRITIIDDKANGRKAFGVAGVRVQCNVFIKFSSTYTDRDGYYKIPKSFSANPRYRLIYKNSKGFTVGLNTIIFPASITTLGRNSNTGVSVTVDKNSDRGMFRRCCVNNCAWEYFERCDVTDLNITLPPSNTCFWCFESTVNSSAIMLHHGTVIGSEAGNIFLTIFSWIVKIFGPDITLGTKNKASYSDIYPAVVHELAHASHFQRVGTDWWNKYIIYVAANTISGKESYGDGSGKNAGKCCVSEMWAYYMENKLYQERYRTQLGSGTSFWFHPQILSNLEAKGVRCKEIFDALCSDGVDDLQEFRAALMELCPGKISAINQAFNRYD